MLRRSRSCFAIIVIAILFILNQPASQLAQQLHRRFRDQKARRLPIRAVIRDAETGRLGSAGQFIQVPDLSKNRLALSGLILFATNKGAGQQPSKAEETKAGEAKAEERDDLQTTPNVRRFSRNSEIDYGAIVYNPALDPKTGKPQLTMQLELYRDGKILHQLPPRPIDPGAGTNLKRMECGGRLKLTGFPPGDYVMRLAVTDPLAKQKYSRAEQWMDFSVR